MLTKKEVKSLESEAKTLETKKQNLQARIWRIEEKLYRSEVEPATKKLIGKCFKYRNSYGQDRNWWLYSKVIGYEGTNLIICTVQTDCYGKVTINPKAGRRSHSLFPPHKDFLFRFPITKKQFDAAINRAIKHLQKMKANVKL